MIAFVDPAALGSFTALLLFLLLAVKCFLAARRERVQSACLNALGLILLLFPVNALLALLGRPQLALALAVPVFLGCLTGSLVLAIVGLVRWHRYRSRYDRGRWQGITALVMCGVFVTALTLGVVKAIGEADEGAFLLRSEQVETEGSQHVLSDYNLSFDNIDATWISIDPENFNEDARLVLRRRRPEQYLMVIPEILGVNHDFLLNGYLEIVQTNIRSAGENVVFEEPVAMEVEEISGRLFTAQARVSGVDLHYEFWCGIKNGLALQVIAFGQRADRELVQATHRKFLSGMHVLDPDRVLSPTGEQVRGRVDHPAEGFSVELPANGAWVTADSSLFPITAFRAESIRGGQLNVSRADLGGLEPTLEAAAAALLALQNMSLADQTVVTRSERKREDGTRVLDLVLLYEDGETRFRDYYRIYARGDQFLMINAWNEVNEQDPSWEPSSLLDSVSIHEELPALVYSEMSDERREAQARFVNQVGLYFFRRDQYDTALAFFTRASDMAREDQIFSRNRIEAQVRMENHEAVLAEAERHLERFAEDCVARGARAFALAALEREKEALATYEKIFEGGCEDDDVLFDYIGLLIDVDQPQGALMVIERAVAERPDRQLLLWEGQVARLAGEYRQSEAAFTRIAEREGWDSQLYGEMVDLFLEAEDYQASWNWLDKQEAQMGSTFSVWLNRGRVQLARGELLDAHVSFTQALDQRPADSRATGFMDEVARRLAALERAEPDDVVTPPE